MDFVGKIFNGQSMYDNLNHSYNLKNTVQITKYPLAAINVFICPISKIFF